MLPSEIHHQICQVYGDNVMSDGMVRKWVQMYDIVGSHLGCWWPHSMRRVYKNVCPATISASIMVANTWKNSLKNVESDNNKILYETLLNFFLQRNGTYFLNKLCISSLQNLDTNAATSCYVWFLVLPLSVLFMFAY